MQFLESLLDYFQNNWTRFLMALVILAVARFVVFLIQRLLKPFFIRREIDLGRQYTTVQIIKYVVYTLAILFALETIGVSLSVLWAGSAALLVGAGLGLQQTFNDFTSGLIILFEGSLQVGDVVLVDGQPARVEKIGLRTSEVKTLDNILINIPNSMLVVEKVTNVSKDKTPSRYQVEVGVEYGSDVELVKKLLLQAAEGHPKILKKPQPRVQFKNFGDSSLDFVLHFYTQDHWGSVFIRSDLRFEIDRLFRENGITIPFPQRDIWIRSQQNGSAAE